MTAPWMKVSSLGGRAWNRAGSLVRGELRRRIQLLEEDIREDSRLTRLAERDLTELEHTVVRLADHSLRKGGS